MSLKSLRREGGSGTYTNKQQQHEQHKAEVLRAAAVRQQYCCIVTATHTNCGV